MQHGDEERNLSGVRLQPRPVDGTPLDNGATRPAGGYRDAERHNVRGPSVGCTGLGHRATCCNLTPFGGGMGVAC